MAVCTDCGREIAIVNYGQGRADGTTAKRGPMCGYCASGDTIRFKSPWFYPTAFCEWGAEETDAVHRVLRSGRLTMGEEVRAFEGEFAAYHGRKHGIMVNSGSSANLVAVAALFHVKHRPLKTGDEVLVPALAWSTTYAPLVQHGLDLRLADCDDTWNAHDFDDTFREVDQPRLVVGCSILGNPAYLAEWKEWCGVAGAYFIEDNCESLGACLDDGSLCGTYGVMSTFSFFHSHQIGAVEGGMVLTDDDELAALCRMLRAHGWTRDIGAAPGGFDQEYDFRLFGYNVRPVELHAAIAREQLRKLPGFIHRRQVNYGLFWGMVDGDPRIGRPTPHGELSPFGIHFLLPDPEARRRAAEGLRLAGIDCRLPTGGSFTKHVYGAHWRVQPTPYADLIHETGLFLGNGPLDLSSRIARAVEVLRGVL